MEWDQVRKHYPHQWLLVEAIQARSESGKRILEQLAVIDLFPDGLAAMKGYLRLHHESPERELYVLHTDRDKLDVTERRWLGIRGIRSRYAYKTVAQPSGARSPQTAHARCHSTEHVHDPDCDRFRGITV